jgi:hypothetical protein
MLGCACAADMAVDFYVVGRIHEYGRRPFSIEKRLIGRGLKRAAAKQAVLTQQP